MGRGALDLVVFAAVLAAALMHAGWNAVVRVGGDRFSSILLLSMTQSGLALILLPVLGAPPAAAWPWVAGASVLHTGYKLFLIRAYQHGDLTQVYPLARGAAPPIVAVGGVLLFHEHLAPTGWLAVALIASGVALMAARGGSGAVRGLPPKALAYALGTAGFVASSTLADGQGARAAKSATQFAMWMFVGDGLSMLAYAVATRGPRAPLAVLSEWRTGLPAVLDRALGLHAGARGAGGGAARDQRAVRAADRGGAAEGGGGPLAGGGGPADRGGRGRHAPLARRRRAELGGSVASPRRRRQVDGGGPAPAKAPA